LRKAKEEELWSELREKVHSAGMQAERQTDKDLLLMYRRHRRRYAEGHRVPYTAQDLC